MSKMSDMAMTIEELRNAAAAINEAANWLAAQFSSDADATPVAEAKTEKKPELTLEEVRAVLAEKSRAGHTAAIRTLLQKYAKGEVLLTIMASLAQQESQSLSQNVKLGLMELQQELVKKANNKEAYDEIADQIFALREKRQQASIDTVQRDEQLQRITELQDFIKDQSSDLTVFDEALVKRWLKQITIWPTHCTVELKSGLKVDVER